VDATLASLSSAEASVEKEVKALLRKNKIRVEDAGELLTSLEKRFGRERKRALKQIEGRLDTLQARVKKERSHLTKLVNEAVQGALSSFNIPSRREVAELTARSTSCRARSTRCAGAADAPPGPAAHRPRGRRRLAPFRREVRPCRARRAASGSDASSAGGRSHWCAPAGA